MTYAGLMIEDESGWKKRFMAVLSLEQGICIYHRAYTRFFGSQTLFTPEIHGKSSIYGANFLYRKIFSSGTPVFKIFGVWEGKISS